MSDQAISTAAAGAPQRTPVRSTPSRTDLRVVQDAKKRSRTRQIACALALVVMFSALLASAVFHSVLVSGQQRLDRLNQRVEQRQQVLSRRQLLVADLSAPSRIVAAAKRRGMVVTNHITWLAATPPPSSSPSSPPSPSAGKAQSTGGSQLASGGGGAGAAGRQPASGRAR